MYMYHVLIFFFVNSVDPNDESYRPELCSEGDFDVSILEEPQVGTAQEPKYIVFESCLKQLLQRCPQCLAPDCNVQLFCVGTMVKATIICPKSHITKWSSQPTHHGKPLGNILLSSAILFSGSSPTQTLRLLSFLGVHTVKATQYFKFQRLYMFPAVTEVWNNERQLLLQQLKDKELCLAGDGRADSPGHSADFGTYSLMETGINRIIHMELVKSTEVSSSNKMEKEGLERALNALADEGMKVKTLITDRHTEIKAFMKSSHPDVQHRFDVWHVAKGIRKKIIAASHSKQHQVLQKWSPTIINHLYWCARTSDDDGELVLAKWQTILRHVIDIHEHPGSLHERCAHGDIGERLWLHEVTRNRDFQKVGESYCISLPSQRRPKAFAT
ncbi:uncharacterized protein LOC135375135 [Ornithodoros turicata]|uniref:uncharacterized protein LOC135375135 n=1 Tax=Ornithodoros turicata TaxID=34597 RepID=UPI00313A1D48